MNVQSNISVIKSVSEKSKSRDSIQDSKKNIDSLDEIPSHIKKYIQHIYEK